MNGKDVSRVVNAEDPVREGQVAHRVNRGGDAPTRSYRAQPPVECPHGRHHPQLLRDRPVVLSIPRVHGAAREFLVALQRVVQVCAERVQAVAASLSGDADRRSSWMLPKPAGG